MKQPDHHRPVVVAAVTLAMGRYTPTTMMPTTTTTTTMLSLFAHAVLSAVARFPTMRKTIARQATCCRRSRQKRSGGVRKLI